MTKTKQQKTVSTAFQDLTNAAVALDIESTLADILTPFRNTHETEYGYRPEGPTSWGFDGDNFVKRDFFWITAMNWDERPLEIPTTEDNLSNKVRPLFKNVGRLDIVTGRQGFDSELKDWLGDNRIYYDAFRTVGDGTSKADFGYDIYIDDRPGLADEINNRQRMLLYDQPYNQDVDERHNVTRIESISEALDVLQ